MAGERSIMKPEEDIGKYVKLLGTVWSYLKLLLKQLRSYESRVGDLAKDVNKLRKEEKIVQNKVREEEKRHGRAIDDDVIKWLKEVDRVICEYDDLLKDEDRPYAVFSDCYLPKPAIRYRLSVIVIDITKKVNVLLQTAKHDNFSYWLGPPSFDADFDNIRYESFASRIQTMDDIKQALEDSNVGMIGVYGWSGVGKTSLIKEVAKQVQGNMFDVVITVNVTSRPDIRSIQGQIADRLGMKLEEESESGRGARLRERLKNPKEKTLVILDNMRVKLDFNMLGIPLVNNFDDSRASFKGCKILMISDSEQLLLSQMDGKGIQHFCVNRLTEKEAESMFKTMAGIGDGNSMFDTLAAQIANKCEGMPRDIVTTANALRNKSLPVWQDAYLRLKRQNLTAMPESSTMLSYDLLENEELKHAFLLCARMGHDALISDLVRYCIGLGLLQGIYTVREARDRVHALVAKLKELSLLSDSFSSDRFTMQDIIRDAALSIASEHMHAFALTKGKLDEWPDMDKLERFTAISLHHCDMTDIMKEFPESINCSRLRVFHLDNKDPVLEIPDNFFNGMKELRVLILIGIHLSSLPSSIKCLKKLRMLCLEQCKLGEHLSIIGELEKLRVLSLSGSDIDKLPVELSKLSKVQIFDISNCFKLKEIPAHVLSSLTSLEELYVGNSPIQWTDEGQENASLSELRQLDQLTTLDIQIPKTTYLPKNFFYDKLDSYKIVIGDFNADPVWDFKMLEMCEASRYLAFQLENGFDIRHQKEIKILFGRVENLLLGQLNDVEDLFYELNYEGFPYLKYLSIVSNSKVKSLINSKNHKHPEKAYPKLESLFLYEVNKMEHILCCSQLTDDSFCKLKIIKLKICGQLKNVFFSSMIKHLTALITIEVSECNSLKEIVTSEGESNGDKINFPELRSLTLQSLSEFIGFYTDVASTGEQVSNELFDEKVVVSKLERLELSSIKIQKIWSDQPLTRSYFQNLMHLDVNDCWNMRHLLSLPMSKSLMNLQSLFVSECGMMESIFNETEVSMIEIEERIFPKLKIINFRSMKRLRKIWHPKFPLHSFGKLDELIIEGCNKLEKVFPSYMVGRFQSLCNLKVINCKLMKEIFDFNGCGTRNAEHMTNLQIVHVEALPKLEHVWNKDPVGILKIEKLKKIWVQECLNLRHIFPVSIAMDLKILEHLEVWDCGQLKEIVSMGEAINVDSILFHFPKLTTTRFSKLPNLQSFYGGAHELRCSRLNNLHVELCHKLKLFKTEIENPEIKPAAFLPEKVIYNVKSMQIEPRDANLLMTYIGDYRMHKLEEFQLSRLMDTEILYFFLHRNPNLKSLLLSNCFFEQLAPLGSLIEVNSGVVPRLKRLKLINLPLLKMIGFEEDTILFQKLECLILNECPCLNTIASSSVSFTYLTNLEVSNCNELRYLITPSTARSLVQLTTMKVNQCGSMETIVSEKENEEITISEKLKGTDLRIIFKQLKEIELVALHKLESFSSSIYAFDFPSLEKFVVDACGSMKSFTFHEQDNNTPILRQICVRHGKEEQICYWKGDLNATIQHMYTIWAIDPDTMAASHPYKPLESSRLKTLKLANCELEPYAIPTVVFPSLKNLEELEVSKTKVKVIFGKMETKMKGYTFPLKKLTLHELPNLTQVWDWSWHRHPHLHRHRHSEEILSFQNLQEVCVTNCQMLGTLFPIELAKKVEKLKKLEIRNCRMFQNIVEQGDATEVFSLPCLTSLDLRMLPNLSRSNRGRFTLKCLDLNRLESLKVDLKSTMMLCNGNSAEDMLHELVELELDFDEDNEVSNFPIQLLEKVSNLEYLQISRSRGLGKLFPSQSKQGEIATQVHLNPVSFSNLKQLSVKGCHGLKNLFTPSTARMLVHLEEMYIVQCESMEEILAKEPEETASEAIKLERLNTITLDSLSSLSCFYSGSDTLLLSSLIRVLIWECSNMKIFSQGVIHAESFYGIQISRDPNEDLLFHQNLNTAVLGLFQRQLFFKALNEKRSRDKLQEYRHLEFRLELRNLVKLELCNCFLPCAIPSSILPYLMNLEELRVIGNDTTEAIFGMNENDTEIKEISSQLKILTLQLLPKLIRVWEKNSRRFLIFRNLQRVNISSCENLQTLFPFSLAKNLEKLQNLEIESCDKLQEIVEKEEDTETNVTEKFVFPLLKRLDLRHLPQVTCFYPQTFTLECPTLNQLSVLKCDELELFQSAHPTGKDEGTSTSTNRQSLISDLKVIRHLEEMTLDWKHILALSLMFNSVQFEELYYLEKTFLFFDAPANEKLILPVEILQKAPSLEEMSINNCNSPDIFLAPNYNIGEDGMLGQLKILTLCQVSALQSIDSKDSSWLNTLCEKLHKLYVVSCPHLTTIVHTVSLSCLKKVSISNCPNLQYLFTSSAAKKLTNLEKITVKDCKSVQKIVAKEGNVTSEAIKFERLNTIVLHDLPSLICFYSGNDTLQLSSLITVQIWECPNMEFFSPGGIYANLFQGIQMSSNSKEDLFFHQDLNNTVRWMFQRQEFFEAMQRTKAYCGPAELQMQNEWLSNLGNFKLDKCTLPYAIPSAILSRLNNLKELEVQCSDQVEVIFYTNHIDTMETTCQLEKLTLEGLSKVKRVVEKNTLIFPNLREVIVRDCENLQILFPDSVAKNLKGLEKLEIKSCQKLQAIVETQTFTLECPALRILSVFDCDVLELFQSAYPTGEGGATSTSINILPFISDTKVIPNLEELTLDWKHISALSLRFTSEQFTEGLKYLKEISLHLGDDENEKSMLPVEILHKAPNAPNPKTSEDRMLGQFKISKPCEEFAVQFMELEDSSWLNTIYEKIQELNGVRCHPLKTIVQKLSFSCLKEVFISNCADLQHLFTSSAARKLMNLEKITIKTCESVKEIVAKEEDATSEAIKFERLNTIVLHSLPSLICFYSGSDTLQLSSLIKMHVWKCPNMKIFSHGVIDAKSFEGIQTSLDADAYLLFHQDLKATVKGMFQRQEFFKYLYETSFPGILADRHGNVPVGLQNRKLGSIKTLKLQKLSLPYAILAHLMNLDELELRDSDQEEVIFDLNDTEIMKTASHLKKLTLHGLSKLKRVWQKNSQGLLIFPDLRELVVSDCANLQTLFPVSLAKKLMELVKLEIKSCDKLQGIVEKEEETATNVTKKFVLPLENLDLCKLPQLTYFYPQAFTLEFPFLKILSVLDCDELELFQIQRAHPMGEGEGTSTSINRQPLVSNIKVIPKLKEMTLHWKHIFALSVSFMSEQFVEDLDYLEKIFLIFDAPENEKLTFPVEILQKAPKLKEMSINNCNSPEIFLAPNHKIGEDGMLGKLKILTLCQVSALQSIESKDPSWLNTICEKLHELYVVSCPHLTTLVHNTVSFSCLKKVSISNCPDLQYLFPSSAVKKLMNLEEITVKECKSVKEIVAKGDEDEHKGEGEDKDKNEMIFGKLKILKLGSLPEFESFYTGCSTLNFPSLREVWFTKCYGAKLFRLGVKVPTELKVTIDGFYWEDDINSAIMQQLEEEVA